MLVLSRRKGERIVLGINGEIVITLVDIDRGKVRIGIEAPREMPIARQELLPMNTKPALKSEPQSEDSEDLEYVQTWLEPRLGAVPR